MLSTCTCLLNAAYIRHVSSWPGMCCSPSCIQCESESPEQLSSYLGCRPYACMHCFRIAVMHSGANNPLTTCLLDPISSLLGQRNVQFSRLEALGRPGLPVPKPTNPICLTANVDVLRVVLLCPMSRAFSSWQVWLQLVVSDTPMLGACRRSSAPCKEALGQMLGIL